MEKNPDTRGGKGENGWSYSGQSTRTSGKTVPVSLSLTCDANGNVS